MNQISKEGSVRVDLVGGTLDIEPINFILPHVVTLNVATSLKAKVDLKSRTDKQIIIQSLDYQKTYKYQLHDLSYENLYQSNKFEEMTFVLQIIDYFNIESGLDVSLSSGAPAGSGLGGSSAMGVTLFSALCDLFQLKKSDEEIIKSVKNIEARILNQGMPGYQDYYPALKGGVLAIKAGKNAIEFEQLYTDELKTFLEEHISLIYSNVSRRSGINNWQVYKNFFDDVEETKESLKKIAQISYETYKCLLKENYAQALKLIGAEGEARTSLASAITPSEVHELFQSIKESVWGLKMCGAGGGGCFIVTHPAWKREQVIQAVEKAGMKMLNFKIEAPLGG